MLILRIFGTVVMAFALLGVFLEEEILDWSDLFFVVLFKVLWRAFIIVCLWVI